ncbi:ThiF family adenylyltransferase [Hymenobacter defluvii]|uniref:ThiF family adenylyltransferase n=1 Tax=Hymenobacter defluvii TaxID=2054411 RepID=A0ABS3TJU0_9BACT|nr:ThiF family adenylyltransferase [Hymenobacter defluvii]MBO3272970.1 ThiF family adenylyltransferase [Hymenobacter defluvii]
MVDPTADVWFFNQFFAAETGVTLLKPFVFEAASAHHAGAIGVSTAKGEVSVTVHIPDAYPQGEALFYPWTLAGYPHQNIPTLKDHGGSLCLSTPIVNHLATRLQLEMQQLHGWLEKYYVREDVDEHYEYVPVRSAKGAHLLFDEEPQDYTAERFALQQSGTFTYSLLRSVKGSAPACLCSGLGNLPARWAPAAKADSYTGIWTLLKQEPVLQRKERIECWQDLLPLLPADFFVQLRQLGLSHQFRRQSPPALSNRFLLAVGYPIPNQEGQEITWDALLLPLNLLRRDASSVKVQNRFDALGRQRLLWGQASNAAYSRFFGRGQLPELFTNCRILLLGVGAIGSCLAETLVRGGVRDLTLADFDAVAPGNICRSRYRFRDIDAPKVAALQQHLQNLSPFVSVHISSSVPATLPRAKNWEGTVELLGKYDLIVDCSANNQVLTTLRHAVPVGKVIHLSITEGAEELIAVVDDDICPLQERREQLLAHISRAVYPDFREGAGCWHPTFRASGAQIEFMVGLAISELAEMARQKKRFRTFSLQQAVGRGIQVSVDQQYEQLETGLKLLVTSECLDQIREQTLLHYPKEFGGVLIGNYSEDGSCAVVSRIIIPSKYRNSPTSFTPDPTCINRQLRQLPDQLQYLGDWHSHPDGPGTPSPTDKAAIAKLAAHPDVRTRSPLLLIAQTRRHQVEPHFFVQHQSQLLVYSPATT